MYPWLTTGRTEVFCILQCALSVIYMEYRRLWFCKCNALLNTVFIRIEAPGAKTKFWGVPLFKKSNDQYITDAALKYNLVCEPISAEY